MEINAKKVHKVETNEDILKAAQVLAIAFQDEPMMVACEARPGHRARILFEYFLIFVKICVRKGWVYATSKNFEAVSLWFPSSDKELDFWSVLKLGGLKLLRPSTAIFGIKSLLFSFSHDRLHDRYAPFMKQHVPHVYLFLFGVSPEHVNKGCGSQLMRSVLAELDRQNLSCYFETAHPRTVAMSERFGFQCKESMPFKFSKDIKVFAMLRESQPYQEKETVI